MIENPFEYGKLRGRIKEKCGIQNVFARDIGLSEVSISNKLNNNVEWGARKNRKGGKSIEYTTLQLIQMKALLLNPSFQCFHK